MKMPASHQAGGQKKSAAKSPSKRGPSKAKASGRGTRAKSVAAQPKARAARPRAGKPASAKVTEAEAKTTTDLEEIKAWAEKRGGKPASVKGTEKGQEAGLLRIDFPGGAGEDKLEPVSWEDWFQKFQEKNLAFLYQEETKDGKISRFFKLVSKK
jgi:hypothetical protein